MCGIAGILQTDGTGAPADVLQTMTDALVHRGPDGEGIYRDGPVGLGHRRLKIIDLTPAGDQPMATEDGKFVIAYNGEVYNFRELRADLEKRGHRFRSRTDTEVVLHAYREWGTDALARFNGMFAFAIWDKERRELFLARDRYGMKPLYYTIQGNVFLFASEQKAIILHPRFRNAVDGAAFVEYFTFQNILTDRTLLKEVRLLPAGCWMRLRGDRARPTFGQYWDFHFQEPEKPSRDEEYAEELDRLFTQAVRRQLVSDVEVGTYLSGGIDSGSVTAIAAKSLPYIKTFTCGFDLHSASGLELGFDEREEAEHLSYLLKTEHYEMVLKAGDMERVLPALAWHLEEPRVGQSYPNYYVSQLASKFVKVVLSGAGGDELFGGYPWRYYRAVVNDNFQDYVDKYYGFWQRLLPNDVMPDLLKPIWDVAGAVDTREIFRSVFHEHAATLTRPEDYINHSLYFEAKTFLHGLLTIEDKLSMAHGLEMRSPFLDNDLVDFAMRIPVRLKLRNLAEVVRMNENDPGVKTSKYYERTRDGKLLLRNVMERHLPHRVTDAVKRGFSAPDASWFRGESIEYVRRLLNDDGALIYRYLDKPTVMRLVNEHLEGRQNRRLFVWSLLNMEWWCRRYAPDA